MEVDSTVPVVQNMLLLDSEGKRIAVKYFDQQWYFLTLPKAESSTAAFRAYIGTAFRSTIAQQSNYEKSVFSKTSRTNARGEGTHLQSWYAPHPTQCNVILMCCS